MEGENLHPTATASYTFSQFFKCKEIIEDLLDNIDLGKEKDPEREKKIFGQVIKKLANHISYDYEHIKDSDRLREVEKLLVDTGISEEEKKVLRKEKDKLNHTIDYITPRNMVGGLINGTCVCVGYSEIVRNVFAYLGIEAKVISGSPKEGEGHAWNQIKLDGKWYNMDLTWARDSIISNNEPCCLLMSDKDFNGRWEEHTPIQTIVHTKGHEVFSERRSPEEICDITVPTEKLYQYLHPESIERGFLRMMAERLKLSQVQIIGRKIIDTRMREDYRNYIKSLQTDKDGIAR